MIRLSVYSKVVVTALAGMLLLTACSTADKKTSGREVDYKKSRATESLEVPPDLTSTTIEEAPAMLESATTSLSEFNEGRPSAGVSTVLPDQKNMHVQRDGNQQWLVIQGEPAQLWPRVRDFWVQQGFLIETEDPRVGIIVTGWAENRADIPQDPIRNVLSKVIDSVYSAATRDQYRVRLEKGVTPDTTEIYLTQRGMEEVVTGTPGEGTTTWKPRPTDPELEAVMLKRLMVYLGVEEQKAQAMLAGQTEQKARAHLITGADESMLVISEDFSRAWRRTGVALDRVGFAVEDRNRAEGTYFVRYSDPLSSQDDDTGLFSKLAFWSSKKAEAKQYRIVLLARGTETRVIVNDAEGQRENSTTSKRILVLLEEQLR
jgi:outer membrane protein assembly factor BamC